MHARHQVDACPPSRARSQRLRRAHGAPRPRMGVLAGVVLLALAALTHNTAVRGWAHAAVRGASLVHRSVPLPLRPGGVRASVSRLFDHWAAVRPQIG